MYIKKKNVNHLHYNEFWPFLDFYFGGPVDIFRRSI